jgi:hypothetical protein
MVIQRRKAILSGIIAIAGVIGIQAFNSFACYGHDFWSFLGALGIFLSLPLLPAVISLMTANPLRAIGACLLFAPWLFFAYYTDCVRPYTGGGASMIYIAVILGGTPSSIIGALVTGPILRAFGISVGGR